MSDNFIDLSNCKKKQINNKEVIDWNNSIDTIVPFLFNGIKGEFIITDYNRQKDKGIVYFKYQDNSYSLRSDYFKKCLLKSIFPNTCFYKYNVGDVINNKLILEHIYINTSNNHSIKGYKIKCLKCNKESNITIYNIDKNKSCKYCACITKPLICKERPDLKQYFQEKDMVYYFTATLGSNKKLNFICPHCNLVKENKMTIGSLVNHGFKCPICSDKISMGEKYVSNLLKQLKVCYESQFSFSKHIDINGHKYHPVYDFVLHKEKIIIEVDGVQHNEDKWKTHIGLTIPKTDELKNNFAKKYGYTVIRIPYKSYKFDDFKNEIQNKLSYIFNLSLVDFKKCQESTVHSVIYEVINLWNLGLSLSEIANETKLNKWTLIDYLHIGVKLNLCEYTTKESMSRSQKYRFKQQIKGEYYEENVI